MGTFNLKNIKTSQFSDEMTSQPMAEPMPEVVEDPIQTDISREQESAAQNLYDYLQEEASENDLLEFEAMITAQFGDVDSTAISEWLNSEDPQSLREKLITIVGPDKQEAVVSFLDMYREIENTVPEQEGYVPAVEKHIASFVQNVNDQIKKEAQKVAKTNYKAFNLKTAQAKSIENTILWGPDEKRWDAFAKQPVSDWNIVERNKGFGGFVGDVANFDWEAFWRGNIMDKYSRPYRDSKTGEWIGGYLQKRFEVDKRIPEGNNYQLKPGERRKPRLPQYGLTEARMEDMRSKPEYKAEHGPTTSGSPTNWNLASSKKKKYKVAEGKPRDPFDFDTALKFPGDKKQNPASQVCTCPVCGAMGSPGKTCPNNCIDAATGKPVVLVYHNEIHEKRPNYPGEQDVPTINKSPVLNTEQPLNVAASTKKAQMMEEMGAGVPGAGITLREVAKGDKNRADEDGNKESKEFKQCRNDGKKGDYLDIEPTCYESDTNDDVAKACEDLAIE